jgi:hypothetical protein
MGTGKPVDVSPTAASRDSGSIQHGWGSYGDTVAGA